ncbi:hypothetical protein QUA74_18835 [Microcoleus sp. LAD1_D3]
MRTNLYSGFNIIQESDRDRVFVEVTPRTLLRRLPPERSEGALSPECP